MARKPTDVVQTGLRIREALRRRLEAAAAKRGISFNGEAASRLERSFEEDAARSIDIIASDMAAVWERYSKAQHAANKLGDLMRAAEALLHATAGVDRKPVQSARTQVEVVIRMIEAEAALAVRKAHTTGTSDG